MDSYVIHGVSLYIMIVNVFTALSASPLEEGWYGDVFTWRIPFLVTNSENSALVNGVPLSETMTFGIPCIENSVCKCSIVA